MHTRKYAYLNTILQITTVYCNSLHVLRKHM